MENEIILCLVWGRCVEQKVDLDYDINIHRRLLCQEEKVRMDLKNYADARDTVINSR